MKLMVNGEERECPAETTLAELIGDLGIKVKVMAAAVNMEVVRKDEWESRVLQENDRVELLHFVGGG